MDTIKFINQRNQIVNFSNSNFIRQSYEGFFDSSISTKTEKGVNQFGATITKRIFQSKTLSIKFVINTSNKLELEAAKKGLLDILNPGIVTGKLVYENDSGTQFEIDCEVSNLTMPSGEARGNTFQVVLVSFLAPDPRFKKVDPRVLSLQNGNHTVINNGTVRTPVFITISGPTNKPTISNITDKSKKIILKNNLQDYEQVEIVSDYGKKAVFLIDTDTGVKRKAMRLLNLNSSFFDLHPGQNRILVDNCDNGVVLEFYERFLEIY